jgi:hypothetical protein
MRNPKEPKLIDPIAENIPWYDAIANSINEILGKQELTIKN